MVKEMISDGTGNAVELEGEGDGDTLEVRRCPMCLECIYATEVYGVNDFCLGTCVCFSMSMTPMRLVTGWCWGGALTEWCMLGETSATRSESPSKRSQRGTAGRSEFRGSAPTVCPLVDSCSIAHKPKRYY